MVLCLGEPPRRFLLLTLHFYIFIFIFDLLFIFDLHFVVVSSFFDFLYSYFIYFSTSSLTLPWTICRVFTPILYFELSPSQGDSRYFHFQLFCYLLTTSSMVLSGRFLPYAPSPTFLTQPAFIKASLGAGSYSLKFAGLHTDPRITDPVHLFVWFKVNHNLNIQNDSYFNSTIY